ncbi:MAG: prepilin-type N-terminal cleavage/methylation domain-containing protein [Pseudomonadales bacterium]|nr:prepilin-type N-terminal cleavage/methylation domain-containing protein [Pseudomonadales bacterium]MCP5185857.1 prepilin-type N-terminal cleavage/methylation domain-containing protein [Pseudomonadales bacterium]
MNSHAPARRAPRGFSLVEMTAALAIAAMLLGGLYSLVSQTNILRDATEAENRTALALQEVMERIVRHIGGSRLLIQPSKSGVRNLLAVSLPASVDRDGDGFADADNDKDGLLDEDRSADLAKDGKPGIRGIDDDGDGSIDENSILTHDDDEDGTINEDGLNLHDDDGDGAIDEDYGSLVAVDDDGDGSTDEDWIDPVVYYLSGASLVERLPVPWDVDGSGGVTGVDYVENTVLSGVTLFEVQREDLAGHKVLVHVRLIAMDTQLQVHELSTAVLIGSRQ